MIQNAFWTTFETKLSVNNKSPLSMSDFLLCIKTDFNFLCCLSTSKRIASVADDNFSFRFDCIHNFRGEIESIDFDYLKNANKY